MTKFFYINHYLVKIRQMCYVQDVMVTVIIYLKGGEIMKKLTVLMFLLIVSIFALSNEVQAQTYTDDLYDYTSLSYNGSYLYTKFNTTITVESPWYGGYNVSSDGLSKTAWLGTNPYNADKITHRDEFTYSKFGFGSITFSWPPGMDFESSSKTMSIEFVEYDNWRIEHEYAGIEAATPVGTSITHYTQKAMTTYEFGIYKKTVQATDDVVVW